MTKKLIPSDAIHTPTTIGTIKLGRGLMIDQQGVLHCTLLQEDMADTTGSPYTPTPPDASYTYGWAFNNAFYGSLDAAKAAYISKFLADTGYQSASFTGKYTITSPNTYDCEWTAFTGPNANPANYSYGSTTSFVYTPGSGDSRVIPPV